MDFHFRNACYSGNLELIKDIVEPRRHEFKSYNSNLINPVFICASRGQLKSVQYLITIIPLTKDQLTQCIKMSALSNHIETFLFLINSLKEFPQNDNHLIYTLYKCILIQNLIVVDCLLMKGLYYFNDDFNALFACAKIGDTKTMQRIIDEFQYWHIFESQCLRIALQNNQQNFFNYIISIRRKSLID